MHAILHRKSHLHVRYNTHENCINTVLNLTLIIFQGTYILEIYIHKTPHWGSASTLHLHPTKPTLHHIRNITLFYRITYTLQ